MTNKEFNLSDWLEQSSWAYMCLPEDKVKEFIRRKNAIPNKSLESTGLDLCGFSQDDVWERAIEWFKEQENKLAGDKLK